MERMLSLPEVLYQLQWCHITQSEQMVRRWLREGQLKGTRSQNKKEGWMVSQRDLDHFIERKKFNEKRMAEKIKFVIDLLEKKDKEIENDFERGLHAGQKVAAEVIRNEFAFLLDDDEMDKDKKDETIICLSANTLFI